MKLPAVYFCLVLTGLAGKATGVELWYDFEGDSVIATDKLPSDGAQNGTLENNVSIQASNALFGAQSAQFEIPDPPGMVNPPFSTIEIPGSTALAEDFTLAMHVENEEAALDFTRLFSSYGGTGPVRNDRLLFDYDASGGVIPGIRAIINNTVVGTAAVPAGLGDPGYHHVALTVDSGDVRIYFDGSLVASGNVGSDYSNTHNLHIGEDPHDLGGSANEQLLGNVDDVLVIGRALAASQIAALAAGTPADTVVTPDSGYAVYYDFEGDSGTTITDKFTLDGAQNGIVHQNAGVGSSPRIGANSGRLGEAEAGASPFSRITVGPVGNLGSEFTMSATVNFPQAGHSAMGLTRLFSTWPGTGPIGDRLIFDFNPDADVGDIGVRIVLPGSTTAISGDTLALNETHTMTATYADGDLRLYVDGNEVAMASTAGDIDLGPHPLYIGEDDAGPVNENFIGTMDDVFITGWALSAAQVRQVHREGAASVLRRPGYARFSAPIVAAALPGGFDEDADGDCIQNGIEYILGTDPLDRASGPPEQPAMIESGGVMGFRIPTVPAAGDVTLVVERSSDLSRFVQILREGGGIGFIFAGVTVMPDPTDPTRRIVTGPPSTGPKEYRRLRVALIAP